MVLQLWYSEADMKLMRSHSNDKSKYCLLMESLSQLSPPLLPLLFPLAVAVFLGFSGEESTPCGGPQQCCSLLGIQVVCG